MRACFYLLLSLTLSLALALTAAPARAQTPGANFGFAAGGVARLVQGSDTLAQAWAGGLNSPQFSSLDLDGDGRADLFAFDRQTQRVYTFLNAAAVGGGPGRRWLYAPQYEALFPADLQYWALLRDYDCDGRPDLFTFAPGGDIRVFRNAAGAGGRPAFALISNQLTYLVSKDVVSNINAGVYNLPAIQDVNGDGRLDILCYDFVGSTLLSLYLNTSPGPCGGVGDFTQASNYWGQLQACASECAAFDLPGGAPCQVFLRALGQAFQPLHSSGHSVLLLDLNGDGRLDLLDGRDNCPQLTRLLNAGASSAQALLPASGASSAFPSAAAPVSLPVFPAAYWLDATFDGVPDLLVASNMSDNVADRVSQRQSVRLYQNAAASGAAVPQLSLANNVFLQGEMLDVSEAAAPTFGDLDGDGLPDMLVGNGGDLVGGYYRASLWLYRNVGSAARPVFRLATDDYLGLGAAAAAATVRSEALRPVLVDLNRDGALDLVYSVYDGKNIRLAYLLNAATAGQPARFEPAAVRYLQLPGTSGQVVASGTDVGDSPCFFDVDGDGYPDLLLGTNTAGQPGSGSLRYFRHRGAANPGPALDNAFALVDADYGRLRAAANRPPNLAPAVADFDGDGRPDLLTADGQGTLTLYPDFRAQAGAFVGRTELFFNSFSGFYEPARLGRGSILHFGPAAADLNQDGTPELYLGTQAGGVQSFLGGRGRTVLAARPAAGAGAALALSLYPNPATATATAETAQPTRLRVLDLTGRAVRETPVGRPLQRTHTLDLRGLAPGLYLVQAIAADGTTATRRLCVE